MQFSLTVSQSWNFCAADLMNRYAMNRIGVYFARDHFWNAFLSIHGKKYSFDHWHIQNHEDHTCTVTVFLKEKRS